MAKFSGVSTWYQVGPSWVKMSTSWAKMRIVLQSCWGRAGELVPKKKGARDAAPRELAQFLSRAQAVRTQFPAVPLELPGPRGFHGLRYGQVL